MKKKKEKKPRTTCNAATENVLILQTLANSMGHIPRVYPFTIYYRKIT